MMKADVEADQSADMDGRSCLPQVEGGRPDASRNHVVF
jgi:hypothetical protein